jgi:hypothetical protein
MLDRFVPHADGHDEIKIADGRSCPIRGRESLKQKHAETDDSKAQRRCPMLVESERSRL